MNNNEFMVNLVALGFKGFQGYGVLQSLIRYSRVAKVSDDGTATIVSQVQGSGEPRYTIDKVDMVALDNIYNLYEDELSNPELANLSKDGWDNLTTFEKIELAVILGVIPDITTSENSNSIDWLSPEAANHLLTATNQDAPGKCPYCGSYNVDYGMMYPDGDYMSYETHCCHCHKDWDEIYNISFSHNQKLEY